MRRHRLVCLLVGHDPRGPVSVSPEVLYECHRCKRRIRFVRHGGWRPA